MKQDHLNIYRNSILQLMNKNNIAVSALARAVKVPQPTLYRLLKGKTSDIKLSTLIEIADYFSVTLTELAKNPKAFSNGASKNDTFAKIPILTWKEINSKSIQDNNKLYIYPSIKCSDQAFALKSKPAFEHIFSISTVFIVEPTLEAIDGDYIIVNYSNSSEATIRKLVLDGPIAEIKNIHSHDKEPLTDKITIIGPILQSVVTHRNDLTLFA